MEGIETKENLPQPRLEIRQEKSLEFIAQSIHSYEDVGDEEAVFMLALTLEHPEWKDDILEQIKKHKPHVKDVGKILERLEKDYFSSGWQSQIQPNAEDAIWWTEHLPEAKMRITNLISYFRPSADEIAKKVVIIPSDRLLPSKETGQSFHIGDTTVIMSHTENPMNLEHEFLHGIINPITEELAGEIPQEKVVALASEKLKKGEEYGEHALSILNEDLIRTYNEFIENEKLNIAIINNELREIVYQLYQRFNKERKTNPKIKFKDFFAREIKSLFG